MLSKLHQEASTWLKDKISSLLENAGSTCKLNQLIQVMVDTTRSRASFNAD